MQKIRRLEEKHARFRRTQPTALTPHEVDQIRELTGDLPALWAAPTTTPTNQQRIIRSLVERVEATVEGTTDQVRMSITWARAQRTFHTVTRPVLRYEQTSGFSRLMARIRVLRAEGPTFAAIAERLNAEGFRPPKGAGHFHKDIVSLIVRRRTPGYQPPPKSDRSALGPNEWFVVDLAREVAADPVRLLGRSGGARPSPPAGAAPRGWWEPAPSAQLTTPKRPPAPYRRT